MSEPLSRIVPNETSPESVRQAMLGINKTIDRLNSITKTTVPASATASGRLGDMARDANYLYLCVADNTWKRIALSSW